MTKHGVLAITTVHRRRRRSLARLAAEINRAHERACRRVREGLAYACQAGEALIEAKGRVPHGEFGDWVQTHCTVTHRTAQKYMQLARRLPGFIEQAPRVADLSFREALELVVSNSSRLTPLDEAQRQEVLSHVEKGLPVRIAVGRVMQKTPDDGNKGEVPGFVVLGRGFTPDEEGSQLMDLLRDVLARPKFAKRVRQAKILRDQATSMEQAIQDDVWRTVFAENPRGLRPHEAKMVLRSLGAALTPHETKIVLKSIGQHGNKETT